MALKKLTLSVPGGKRPSDPLEIFKRLTLRGSIENIWEPQAEALKNWHKVRSHADVAVRMNTGGGKTLVGLLMAQSLVNETRGRVLYVCPNNQLVEQTHRRASEISLAPALRYDGGWENKDNFDSGDTFCITNYAAVFNGKSVFFGEDVQALVFDDAHVAENTMRGQFTLDLPSDHASFGPLLAILRKHFAHTSQANHLQDISEGRPISVLFVPTFVVWQQAAVIRKALLDAKIDKEKKTLFAWEHLKDHLNHCCMLIGHKGIQITPSVLPLAHLDYFQPGVRRLFLTATLPSLTAFSRTFGLATPTMIEPSGKSGDAQRLFVFVPGKDDDEQHDEAMVLLKGRKCCVVCPSATKAADWVPPATLFDKDDGQSEIDRFAKSKKPEMLGLVARYDGIDLPGDTCRILALDRLPQGETLIDRFIDETIRIEAVRTSHTATRVVQAIGRIFRSNTDHGVVLLVGKDLQAWLRNRKHAAYLPKLVQQQILLAAELAKKAQAGEVTWKELIDALLAGDENWDEMYNEYIDRFETEVGAPPADWHVDFVKKERVSYELLWQGQYAQAALAYGDLADLADKHDPRLAAWYRHWRGLAHMCNDDREAALHEYVEAANVRAELGRPSGKRDTAFKPPKASEIGFQAKALASWYRSKRTQITAKIKQVETDLQYGEDVPKAEEATQLLGNLLGLKTDRPDKKSKGRGPDVVWYGEGKVKAWGLELKTNKDKEGEYDKDEIGQAHQHEQWLDVRFTDQYEIAIIGRELSVSSKSDPSPKLSVVTLEAVRELLGRSKALHESVDAGDKADLEGAFQAWIDYFGLNWPLCLSALESKLAIDLRADS